ncbi:uncharacterized protein Z520_06967 [Fonsecaea multimorphosa CBS 102226]|uniref:F-box domain-containing protein n=1 Tax=Fonsecaea multimorphosa CBS 102226 TaxID=1442371 RepID=A0A0D2H6N3_9EURO|nr:uncharacterized protein Z520_06967 [Fonsecaea multimorphosa CBS 102226]KIX97515.1 hypothetical protein Z520_06967 [Fonsecaea multimorphosa CBS 102226]OAL23476.1 hypothetical protein AYO22_06526 [Fonsecaea multimorphosa]
MATQELQLAVFSGNIHGVLAFLASPRTGHSFLNDAEQPEYDFDYADDHPQVKQKVVEATLPRPVFPVRRRPLRRDVEESIQAVAFRYCGRLIRLQNSLACTALSAKGWATLQSLSLYMWDIMAPELTKLLASQFADLEELRLGFCHPYIHDHCLPLRYWDHPDFLEPSPIWDALCGIGEEHAAHLRLKKLKKLTLQRSGISRDQLQKWIECNPGLVDLRLHHVAGVDAEFVQWLGTYYRVDTGDHAAPPAKLRTLALESCTSLSLGSLEDLSWLDSLLPTPGKGTKDPEDAASVFQVLSFRDSTSVSTSALMQYLALKQPQVRQVTLPSGRVLVENATDPNTDCSFDPAIYGRRAHSTRLKEDDQDSSPVPYLRFLRFRRRAAGNADEIIEPDPRCA